MSTEAIFFQTSFLQNLTANYLQIPSGDSSSNLGDGIAYCGSNIGNLFGNAKDSTRMQHGSGK
jgi:hypothetical protein